MKIFMKGYIYSISKLKKTQGFVSKPLKLTPLKMQVIKITPFGEFFNPLYSAPKTTTNSLNKNAFFLQSSLFWKVLAAKLGGL